MSLCCQSKIIKGGILNNTRILLCSKCKRVCGNEFEEERVLELDYIKRLEKYINKLSLVIKNYEESNN